MNDETSPPEPPAEQPVRRSRAERREQAAIDVLRTLCRDTFIDRFGPHAAGDEDMPISLRLTVRAGEAWDVAAEPGLREQLEAQFDEIEAGHNAYSEGCVYCFRCGRSGCEHGAPSSPLSVFSGYSPTGVPEWCEFAQHLIDTQDEEVDRLYGRSAATLVRVVMGKDLRSSQLGTYGRSSKTYSVLGQVVVGYFALTGEAAALAGSDRLALTFQVVETRETGGMALKLNLVAALPRGVSPSDLFALGWAPYVRRAHGLADNEVRKLTRRARDLYDAQKPAEARTCLRAVPALLGRLARSLERGDGQSRRRTVHAERRREDRRPVHKAMEDLRTVAPGCFYRDERAGTYIVCGPQGRTHAFSVEGRHVTSFSLQPGAVDTRLRTRRWSSVGPDEAERLRGAWLGAAARPRE